ncbi:MAG TPA: DcaP family trimeric outer membrane transporter [Verrucomicrobiae bacterium]|nr:DcaP family trimeric outer membrane transporter [Verrucomicrobiae bacterium]
MENSTRRWFSAAGTFVVMAALLVAFPGTGTALAQDNTPHVEVYGFVQADYIQDFKRVDPAWNDTLRPSKIPTTDDQFGEDGQASLSAKQSRLGVLMNFPTSNHPVYTKFEFDMFGVGVDEGQTTIRLRHAYGEWNHWLAGQTNTLFMDASIFPNVIDYWGPAGMVFIRNPQIRYSFVQTEHRTFSIAIERPSSDVDPGQIREIDPALGGVTGSEKVPDFTAQFRNVEGWGHWQVAGLLRKVAFDTPGAPDAEPKGSETGYGVDLTGSLKLGKEKKNSIMAGVVWGKGIASYMNDGGVDLSADGTLVDPEPAALPLLGVSAYYNQYWSDRFSSAFGYSFTKVDNRDLQAVDAYHNGEYASANLLYYPTKNVMCGGEALWGKRTDNDDDSGDDLRVQFSFHYSFSTKDVFKKNTRESGT